MISVISYDGWQLGLHCTVLNKGFIIACKDNLISMNLAKD